MELCKNGKSVRMGFLIRRKSTGEVVADISAVIPIIDIDSDYRWWELGVLAFLHSRGLPTHWESRQLFSAEPKVDYHSRHAFVERELTRRNQQKAIAKVQRQAAKLAAKGKVIVQPVAPVPTPATPVPIDLNRFNGMSVAVTGARLKRRIEEAQRQNQIVPPIQMQLDLSGDPPVDF